MGPHLASLAGLSNKPSTDKPNHSRIHTRRRLKKLNPSPTAPRRTLQRIFRAEQ
jgi:hypothetical protein